MAVKIPANSSPNNQSSVFAWSEVAEGDTFVAAMCSSKNDKSVQFNGSFGGGSIGVEGSLDGVNYHSLKDLDGNTIAATADSIFTILENILYIRPSAPQGATGMDVNVTVLAR